ncbi:hypothetical protein DIJ61_36810 [Burkholderia pseudomallei]|nr:hypothetical protein DIJ61_36810 [Burkholderia pseudomallei]
MRGSEDRDRVPSKGNPVESKRKLPTVSVEWLENAAADLEVSANASRETWAVLGLSRRYSENRGGLTRSDSFLRFLSGTSEAIMLPI